MRHPHRSGRAFDHLRAVGRRGAFLLSLSSLHWFSGGTAEPQRRRRALGFSRHTPFDLDGKLRHQSGMPAEAFPILISPMRLALA